LTSWSEKSIATRKGSADETESRTPNPEPDVAGLIRTVGSLLKDCKEGHCALQQARQVVADGPAMISGALHNHQVDDATTWHTRTEAARAVSVQLQAIQQQRLEQLGSRLPELEAGVKQLTAALERLAAAPRRSYYDTEPDTSISDAERRTRLEYLLNEALPVLRDGKFWLDKHVPQAS
jgi:hypothetical protein